MDDHDDKERIEWQRGKVIGTGRFGCVYSGLDVRTGQLMAVKMLNVKQKEAQRPGDTVFEEQDIQEIEREIDLVKSLQHQHVVKYLGRERLGHTMFIFIEYLPLGSVGRILKYVEQFSETACHRFLKQLLQGLAWLHEHGVAHRDLKCDNLLLSDHGELKIGDFGSAKRVLGDSHDTSAGHETMRTARAGIGSPYWMSPEIIRAEYSDDVWRKADVWGVGCVAIEMLTGKPPWSALSNPMSVMYHIASTTALPDFPADTSAELSDFIRCCLTRDASMRFAAADLLYHPFITQESGMFVPWAAAAKTDDRIDVPQGFSDEDELLELDWTKNDYTTSAAQAFVLPELNLDTANAAYYDPASGWWYDPTTEKWHNLWAQSEQPPPQPWFVLDIASWWLAAARESLALGVSVVAYPVVRVLGDYDAGDDSELTLVENQGLYVMETNDDGWWYGCTRDGSKEGYFPCTYVEYVNQEEQDTCCFPVRAVESLESTDASMLTLDENEIIHVLHRDESGWWYGCNSNNESGWIPSTLVEEWTAPADDEHPSELMVCQDLDDLDSLLAFVGIAS